MSPSPQQPSHHTARIAPRFILALTYALLLGACATYQSSPGNARAIAPHEGISGLPWDMPQSYESRPGLGTSLGYEVGDNNITTHFYRRSFTNPDTVASFHYNDEEGAKAMAELSGSASKHSGQFDLADGRIRAALVTTSYGDDERSSWYAAGGKVFVIGRAGATYAIDLENPSKERVEAVVSVDGLDVLSGVPASFTNRGYVIAPRSRIRIDGMRVGGKMHSFQFGSVRDSHAAKTGGEAGARNVGVIGIALFIEDEGAARQARLAEGFRRQEAVPFQH